MTSFEVKDMTCGHCVKVISQAVLGLDPAANVQIDLPAHRVHIESASVQAAQFSQAIAAAGYSPVASTAGPLASAPALKAKGGCCCQ